MKKVDLILTFYVKWNKIDNVKNKNSKRKSKIKVSKRES